MKKTITKILLASIILLGFGNINQTNASDLDGFESIFNAQEEFSCVVIDREITHYPKYKGMIDNYFRKISTKSYAYKKNIYSKLGNLADRKLTTINKTKQERIYAIIGYIKCESQEKLEKLNDYNNYYDDNSSNNYGGKKCYGNSKGWSDYGKYSSVGFHKQSVYSKEYNTTAWFNVECKVNGKWGVPKFVSCNQKGCNVGLNSKGKTVGVPYNKISYLNEKGKLTIVLNGKFFKANHTKISNVRLVNNVLFYNFDDYQYHNRGIESHYVDGGKLKDNPLKNGKYSSFNKTIYSCEKGNGLEDGVIGFFNLRTKVRKILNLYGNKVLNCNYYSNENKVKYSFNFNGERLDYIWYFNTDKIVKLTNNNSYLNKKYSYSIEKLENNINYGADSYSGNMQKLNIFKNGYKIKSFTILGEANDVEFKNINGKTYFVYGVAPTGSTYVYDVSNLNKVLFVGAYKSTYRKGNILISIKKSEVGAGNIDIFNLKDGFKVNFNYVNNIYYNVENFHIYNEKLDFTLSKKNHGRKYSFRYFYGSNTIFYKENNGEYVKINRMIDVLY